MSRLTRLDYDGCSESLSWPPTEFAWEDEAVLDLLSPLEQAISVPAEACCRFGDIRTENKEENILDEEGIEETNDLDDAAAAVAAVELKCTASSDHSDGLPVSNHMFNDSIHSDVFFVCKSSDVNLVDVTDGSCSKYSVSFHDGDSARNGNEVLGFSMGDEVLSKAPVGEVNDSVKRDMTSGAKSENFFMLNCNEHVGDSTGKEKEECLAVKPEIEYISSEEPDGVISEDFTMSDDYTDVEQDEDVHSEEMEDDVEGRLSVILREARNNAKTAKLELRTRLKNELAERHESLDAGMRGKLRSRREAAVSRHNKNEYATQLELALRNVLKENCYLRRSRRRRRRHCHDDDDHSCDRRYRTHVSNTPSSD